MNRLDRIIDIFEGYENLIKTAVDAGVYSSESLQVINDLANKRKQITEELELHGCRRRN